MPSLSQNFGTFSLDFLIRLATLDFLGYSSSNDVLELVSRAHHGNSLLYVNTLAGTCKCVNHSVVAKYMSL